MTRNTQTLKKSVTKNKVTNKKSLFDSSSLDDLKNLGMELTILEKEIDILQKRMKDISHKKKISDTLSKISKLN